jgi:hypothetical protein
VIATASLLLAALILTAWLYWITTRIQQMLNRADRQQDVIDRQLKLFPGKSAPRDRGDAVDVPKQPAKHRMTKETYGR